MAKSKTTVTNGYLQGEKHIVRFMAKEIGDEKTALARSKKFYPIFKQEIQKTTKKTLTDGECSYLALMLNERTKYSHHEAYKDFRNYGDALHRLFNYATNPKKGVLDTETINNLLLANISSQNHSLFTNKKRAVKLTWSSTSGINALKKYSDLILKNDQEKLQYCQYCLSKSSKSLGMNKLQEFLSAPTPVTHTYNKNYVNNMKVKMKMLEEKLNKTDGRFHVNSAEYNAMRTALKTLNKCLNSSWKPEELGSCFEALQAASMDYVDAKGVGTQITQRGKDRMDTVLDVCSSAVDGMQYFASKKRIEEIATFESTNFGKSITNGTILDEKTDGIINDIEDENESVYDNIYDNNYQFNL